MHPQPSVVTVPVRGARVGETRLRACGGWVGGGAAARGQVGELVGERPIYVRWRHLRGLQKAEKGEVQTDALAILSKERKKLRFDVRGLLPSGVQDERPGELGAVARCRCYLAPSVPDGLRCRGRAPFSGAAKDSPPFQRESGYPAG
jgi:hypothetical protein